MTNLKDVSMPYQNATIFVQIPSYRDRECIPTVRDLFHKAKYPERISVGICWQYAKELGDTPLAIAERQQQIRILNIPAKESKGVSWAKYHAQSLWQNEEYILQIDSHTRMVNHWDEKMLDELARCASDKPVLSCPPHGYVMPDMVHKDNRPTFRRPKGFTDNGTLVLTSDFFDAPLSKPVLSAFAVPRFIFSSAHILKEVPADPYIYTEEEETTLSARLWTHGWDIYSPGKILLYHLYNHDGKQRPLHWKEQRNWHLAQTASRQRYRYILGTDPIPSTKEEKALSPYTLGNTRTLAAYTAFCGIDIARKRVLAQASHCAFLESIREHKTVDTYWLPVTPSSDPYAEHYQPDTTIPEPVTPALVVGDFIPFFALNDDTNQQREIQRLGGYNIALFFLPSSDAQFLREFFDEIERHHTLFTSANLAPVYIFPASTVELASVKKWLDIPYTLWADEHAQVGRNFGVYRSTREHFTPACFLLSPNLRIVNIFAFDDTALHLNKLLRECETRLPEQEIRILHSHPPVLVIPNLLSKERCEALITWQQNAEKHTDIKLSGELQNRLDDIFSGALWPEIHKVFGSDVAFRENYLIHCQNISTGHTPNQLRYNSEAEYTHRRYALTLYLNENFIGGYLGFPEYGADIYKPEAGTAIISPCALMHRILPVTKGQKFTLNSFFYEREAGTSASERLIRISHTTSYQTTRTSREGALQE